VAQSRHPDRVGECPLSGVKRTRAGSDNHAYRKLQASLSREIIDPVQNRALGKSQGSDVKQNQDPLSVRGAALGNYTAVGPFS
jgi:hypothetical protein